MTNRVVTITRKARTALSGSALAVPAIVLLSLCSRPVSALPLEGNIIEISNEAYIVPFSVLVGGGVEAAGVGGTSTIDLFDTSANTASMTLNVVIGSGFADAPNRIRFFDVNDSIADILNVTLNAAGTSHVNAGADRINFGANFFEYEFGGLVGGPGTIRLDISFADSSTFVPEPGTLALLSLGLLGLGFTARRRLH